MAESKFLSQLQWAINYELIPELQGMDDPINFNWRTLFEMSSARWDRTSLREKARVLGYLETCDEGDSTLLDRIIEEFIQYSKRENRPDSVLIIPYSLKKIRTQIPEYRTLSPCLASPVEYITAYVTEYTKRIKALS